MYLQDEQAELFNGDNYQRIVSLHKHAQIGCESYKQLTKYFDTRHAPNVTSLIDDITAPKDNECNFYDTVGCKEVFVPEDDVAMMMDNMVKYIEKGHFVPFCEVAREFSNLVFVIETKIPYTNNTYRFGDESDLKTSLQMICRRVFKLMGDKSDSRVVVYIRSYKKKVYLKVQFLDHVMDIHHRIHLMKEVVKSVDKINRENGGLFASTYPIRFNEFYCTSALPLNASPNHYYWDIYQVFECRSKYGMINIIESNKTALMELTSLVGNSLAILSINPYVTSYVKRIYISKAKVENYEFNPAKQMQNIMLMKAINDQPRLAFLDILLRHLPEEYKKSEADAKNIIYSLKVGQVSHSRLLAKHHFPHIDDVTFNKYWGNSKKELKLGYYRSIAAKSDGYDAELQSLMERVIENEFYAGSGKISDSVYAMLVNFHFYGKFYSCYDGSERIPKVARYMFVDRDDPESEKKLYKWTIVPEVLPIVSYYLSEELPTIMSKVLDNMGITGSSYSKDEKIKALNKKATAFRHSRDRIKDTSGQINVAKSLFNVATLSPLFPEKIDRNVTVIGVLNGVLDLDLTSHDPKPVLYTGYSPFVVTKHCSAKYIPYEEVKRNGKYIRMIKDLYKGVIPEKDARRKIMYLTSTGLDESAEMCVVLLGIGWGANGKSSTNDPIVDLLDEYAVKLSPNLLTDKRKGSAADPDFMHMMNKRFGLIAETNRGDTLVANRLKAATEKIKEGRGLFKNSENFRSQTTLIVSTNYPLRFEDFDYGTIRRVMVYTYKVRFVNDPDPANPYEKAVNPEYAKLFDNQRAKNELLSWLVHLRLKFHRLYGSDINKVPSPTIDRYTAEYRCEQDLLTQFIYQRIIIMIGYNSDARLVIPPGKTQAEVESDIDVEYESSELCCAVDHTIRMETVINHYRDWLKRTANKELTDGYNNLLNSFKTSALAKFINGDNDLAVLRGMRILELGKSKLKNEMHIPFRK